MRLRLLVLFASALLALVPAFAFADDDNVGDNDREPVALTTPLTAAPTTVAPTRPTATGDVEDDHADRGDRTDQATGRADQVTDRADQATGRADQVTDRADQVTDRATWCQTHAEACAAAITAHTDEIIAWCKAHADKCSPDQLKKALDRLPQCAAQQNSCALATTPRVTTTTHRPSATTEVDKDEKLP